MKALVVAVLFLTPSASAQLSGNTGFREFRIESAHSAVGFTINFLGHPVHGRFNDVRGTIVYVPGKPSASSVTASMETSSINTGSDHRDGHLKSSDFFDSEKYPSIVFRSTSIQPVRGGLVARGNLTMHGVTRPVVVPFRETSTLVKDPHGSTLVYFAGSTRINRRDFGIAGGSKFNSWFDELRSKSLGDSVDISLEIEGWDIDYDRTPKYDATIKKIADGGVDTFLARFRDMYKANRDTLKDAEWDFDQLGRALLYKGRAKDAVGVLEFSASIFPKSSSAQAALARAYEIAGDRIAARRLADTALGLDPAETRAIEVKRRLGN
ncbi:MAG TPA: YceI family protein [Gemmatimonadaceae bacterium]|nr:YceI family protein [Gemmatimonadaceae bacterium]